MGRATVAGGKVSMAAPVNGIALSSLAEGSVVKVNESGTPVEFYVIKHDYESALNGTGRTLLLRKDIHSFREWDRYNQIYSQDYIQTPLDSWLNTTYFNSFGADEKSLMATTAFYVSQSLGSTPRRVDRAVFMLSATEYNSGSTTAVGPDQGVMLEAAKAVKRASYNGAGAEYWTRQVYAYDEEYWCVVTIQSTGARGYVGFAEQSGVRPCFTFPSNTLFDKSTLVFQGVA